MNIFARCRKIRETTLVLPLNFLGIRNMRVPRRRIFRILTRTYTQNNQFFMYICKAQYSMIYNFSEDNKYIS